MKHVQRICQVIPIALLASLAWGEPAESEKAAQESAGTLTARLDQLRTENEALRAENAALKEKLAAMEKTAASKTAFAEISIGHKNSFALNPVARTITSTACS